MITNLVGSLKYGYGHVRTFCKYLKLRLSRADLVPCLFTNEKNFERELSFGESRMSVIGIVHILCM